MENKELDIDYKEFLNAILDGKCVMFVDSSSTEKDIKFLPVIHTKCGIKNVWFLFKRLGFKLDLEKFLMVCPHKYVTDKHSIMDEFSSMQRRQVWTFQPTVIPTTITYMHSKLNQALNHLFGLGLQCFT